MKKHLIMIFCAFILAIPTISFCQQNREHRHAHTDLEQYHERQARYADRWYWQMPQRVMDELGIEPGMSVADVGAGIGYFTLKLSKKVGNKGRVYASDIDENALAFLDERRKEAHADNIVIIHGRGDDPLIPEASVDFVLIVNTIQFVEDTSSFLHNIRRSLKENGKLVFIQWDAEKMDPEMPGWDTNDRERYTLRTMLKMIYDASYEVLEIKDFLPMQSIYVCQPRSASEEKNKEKKGNE